MTKPTDWPHIAQTPAGRWTTDFYQLELVPSTSIVFHGAQYSTNRWGMRDRDRELVAPAGCYRIAMLGSSQVDGWGIADGANFASLLEDRLNRENKGPNSRYEVLNFGVAGYGPLQELMVLENRASPFKSNAIFYVAHPSEADRAIQLLANRFCGKIEIPYGFLKEVAQRAGIDAQMTETEAQRRLKPFGNEMVAWAYRRVVDDCRQKGATPVWIYLPQWPGAETPEKETANLVHLAEEAGFVVLNLADVYQSQDARSLRQNEWDLHPNARGHFIIAERLYQTLKENEKIIPLGLQVAFGSQLPSPRAEQAWPVALSRPFSLCP